MKVVSNIFASLLLFVVFPVLHAAPRSEAVPGGIAIVPLMAHSAPRPTIRYNGSRVMIVEHDGLWHGVVGIPLTAKPGEQQLTVVGKANNKKKHMPFTISQKRYLEQHITLKNKRMVNPLPTDLKRIRGEQKTSREAFSTWSSNHDINTDFILPVEGTLSSPFGKRRFFNGQPRRPHSGIDIAAPKGTPVRAPTGGVVIERGDYFFNGKTLFIDHGQGLVTMFCHLDSFEAPLGGVVDKGQIVARVGSTGRATGPHLHWSVSLNNARINPELFLPSGLKP